MLLGRRSMREKGECKRRAYDSRMQAKLINTAQNLTFTSRLQQFQPVVRQTLPRRAQNHPNNTKIGFLNTARRWILHDTKYSVLDCGNEIRN